MSNKVISIEYTLNDANTNEKLDSNVGSNPLEFISGMGQIIPGLEKEIADLNKDDKVDVMVKPADGYGEYNDEAVQNLPKEQFAGIDLVEGMSLYGTGEQGETVQVTVKSVGETDVTIDYNHPMAGRTLMFTVTIVDVRAATEEELQTGVVGGMATAGGCCGGGSCGTDSHSYADESDSCCGSHTGENAGGCCSSH
ncbi:MAG: peptidylprolyl isomerase [Campylobacterota bacterium]|nr:peptidylprolyl isomerase [Campylobacterota bacterium]